MTEAVKRQKSLSVDIPLLLTVVVSIIFGLLMLYSASWDFSLRNFGDPSLMFFKQVLWVMLGVVVAIVLTRVDYHLLLKLALWMMVAALLLLVAVLFSQDMRHGAVRSFLAGSIQPSELAKLVVIIYLSVWLFTKRDQIHNIQLGLIPLAFILGTVGGLVLLQPDLSATITIFMLGGLLFFLAGGELRQIVLFLVIAAVAGFLVIQLSPHGRERINSFLVGIKNPLEANYHVQRSLEAISKGDWLGVGIGRSSTKLTGLPFPPTDSIFAVIIEELGVAGGAGLIFLYGILLWRGIRIANRAPDLLGMLLASGLTFWIIIEAVINMGMMVGLLPFAGNALPFVSAGGSNMLCMLAAIGILMNISRHSRVNPEETDWRKNGATVDMRRRNGRRDLSRSGRP